MNRLDELLALRACEALSQSQSRELEVLITRRGAIDDGAYDRAAAAILLARISCAEQMPDSLKRSLEMLGKRTLERKPY